MKNIINKFNFKTRPGKRGQQRLRLAPAGAQPGVSWSRWAVCLLALALGSGLGLLQQSWLAAQPAEDFEKAYLLGQVRFATDSRFIQIPRPYAVRRGMYMRKDAFAAFKVMYDAAGRQGIRLTIVSAGRDFWHQKRIWEKKWNGKRRVEGKILNRDIKDHAARARFILRYSSMPGTSRHHWGTDVDIVAVENDYFDRGRGKRVYSWLASNAPRYGYCQPFTPKAGTNRTGYEEERWHWTYLPVVTRIQQAYKNKIQYSDIKGFDGAEVAQKIKVIQTHVEGIDPTCLP